MLKDKLSVLQSARYVINDRLSLKIPTMKQVLEYGEMNYWSLVSMLTATSYDYMVQLDELGVRYEEISDYEMFIMLFQTLSEREFYMIFDGVSYEGITYASDEDTGKLIIMTAKNKVLIDEIIYEVLVEALRNIHGLKRNWKVAGNEFTRRFYIEEAKEKLKEAAKDKQSTLAPLVVALVNRSDFKYDYNSVLDMNLYAFLDSVKQIQLMDNYKNVMMGIYTGNIDAKSITDKQSLTWVPEE